MQYKRESKDFSKDNIGAVERQESGNTDFPKQFLGYIFLHPAILDWMSHNDLNSGLHLKM